MYEGCAWPGRSWAYAPPLCNGDDWGHFCRCINEGRLYIVDTGINEAEDAAAMHVTERAAAQIARKTAVRT